MRIVPVICLIIMSITFLTYEASAQTGESRPSNNQTESQTGTDPSEPIVNIEEQPYEYYYWPEEDLNNFGLSTMESGEGGSTLGRSSERKSNLEINPRREPETEKDKDEGTTEEGEESPEPSISTTSPYEETGNGPDYASNPPSRNPIYKWVDDEGNLHITNNIGDVPLKYQQDYYNSPDKTEY
ncbi:MAG: hypothetical protein RIG61_05370 [Deltaproteobacteria bacterium]